MVKVSRFLEYRRAIWIHDGQSLEAHLRQAWAHLPNSIERTIVRPDGVSTMGAKCKNYNAGGFAIHCVRYVEQQPVGVVPMTDNTQTDLQERRPGNDENFLNNDFFALVSGNNIVTLSAGQRASALRFYTQEMFRKVGLPDISRQFDLLRVPSVGQLAKIDMAGGVSDVQLDMTIEEATISALENGSTRRKSTIQKLTDPFRDALDAIASSDRKSATIAESQKGRLRVTITVPKGDIAAGKSGLDGIAEDIVTDEDAEDYVINLRNGDTIKPSEMAIKKNVRLERTANSVDVSEVFAEMAVFMSQVRAHGQLEI